MRLLWVALALVASPAWSCGVLEAGEQRERDEQDVVLQVRLAEDLARQADVVFVGLVVDVDASQTSAEILVERVIKGDAGRSVRLPANDQDGMTISCQASDMFRNSQLTAGRRYVVYVRGGTVLRAGWTERASGEVSLQAELRAVRRAIGG